MNMTAMNQAAGGPVGGGIMMMNNGGSPAMPNNSSNSMDQVKPLLNTYIYEYFLKNGQHDIARALAKDEKFEMRTLPRPSPGRRKDGDLNGADADAMEMDLKDDLPDDLPRPAHITTNSGHEGLGFLFEWFAIFSDIFSAHRGQGKTAGSYMTPATQYLIQHQQLQRMRESQQNQNLGRPGIMPNHLAQMRASQMRNGIGGGDMNRKQTQQQLAMMQQKAMQQNQQQMPRGDQPDGDPNARPATPADGDGGGSPSKRPRLEGQQFNAGIMPNGRPGVPGVAPQTMMIQNGFNPGMNQARFQQNGGIPPKMPAGMANGMMNISNSGSPMMAAMSQFSTEGMPADMYSSRMQGQAMQGAPNGQSGNHALQDYQMQLMLLEQQNKKRLMMARQEQHDNQPRDGQPMPGGVIPPGMSPSGSRNGTSPNPTEQMKRTAQMIGMPGSPSAGEMQGRSPAGMGFMNGMPQEFNTAMFTKNDQSMMGPGGPGMRPPTSAVDMNAMSRQAQQNRMVNQFQGGQPMVQQQSQGQPQPIGTPGQRNEMPPPSAPATGNSAQRNNQPVSPANSNAPPTPSQSNKPNPKKKGKDEPNRKRPQKKNSTVNAPNSEDNAPAATTPSAPITPGHGNTFNGSGNKGQAPQQPNQQPQQPQAMPPNQQQMPGQDLAQANNFPDFGSGQEQSFNLDFSTLENSDVLENFDFDSFLNTSADDAFNFDGGMVENFNMDAPGE